MRTLGALGRRLLPAARRSGAQAVVEMAFVLPLLLLLVAGIVEFAVMAQNDMTLAGAARDGARAGAISGLTSTQAVQDAVNEATAAATGLVNCPLQTPTATYDSTASPPQIEVSVGCDYSPLTPIGPLITGLFGGSWQTPAPLSESSSWRIEQ